jgi:uncharacterized DUF497 family protein
VRIGFDRAKSEANLAKHGLSLAQAEAIEWDSVIAVRDDRRDYGEPRMIGLGYLGPRLVCVVFADRGDERRIISLRKANSREVRRYAET